MRRAPAQLSLSVRFLPSGDVASARPGAHLILERVDGGAPVHAVKLDGCRHVATIKSGQVLQLSMDMELRRAAQVHYPPPFADPCDLERAQAVQRARLCLRWGAREIADCLQRAGACLGPGEGDARLGSGVRAGGPYGAVSAGLCLRDVEPRRAWGPVIRRSPQAWAARGRMRARLCVGSRRGTQLGKRERLGTTDPPADSALGSSPPHI